MQRNKNESNKLLKSLIGLTKEKGTKLCLNNGYKIRVVREDSNNYAITLDLDFDRINLELDNGIITKCDIG